MLATLLKEPSWRDPAKADERDQIVRAIVAELEKSVACGDLGYIASTNQWVAEQDPDLAEVRTEDRFTEFRERLFGLREHSQRTAPVEPQPLADRATPDSTTGA